jgi:hypothetical protein
LILQPIIFISYFSNEPGPRNSGFKYPFRRRLVL